MTVETRRLPISFLNAEAFAPYGVVIETEGKPYAGRDGERYAHARFVQRWTPIQLEYTLKPPTASIVRYFRDEKGFVLPSLERHMGETQTFVPLKGQGILAVAAPSEGPLPDLSTVRGFLLEGDKGVVMHRGSWMRHFFPVTETAEYVAITARVGSEDLETADLETDLKTVFEFVLAGSPT